MKLIIYLNSNYATRESLKMIVADFYNKFGVDVKSEDDLWLFKYDMLAVKWLEPITHECRGTIVRFTDNGWKIQSRPWDKFFNIDEGHCPIFKSECFDSWMKNPSSRLVEKADGTAIQLWFDDVSHMWRASTLGTITPLNVADYPITFDKLFWEIAGDTTRNVFQCFHPNTNYTFLFELCTKKNRILTRYEKDQVFLIGVRDRNDGLYVSECELNLIAECIEVKELKKFAPLETDIKDLISLQNFVEQESRKTIYGEFPEGFVATENGVPVAKIKNTTYRSLHHLGGGDKGHTRNVIIEAFFTAHIDDIIGVLDPDMVEFVEKIRNWHMEQTMKIMEVVSNLKQQEYATQKDYALAVKSHNLHQFDGLFFSHRSQILSNEFNHSHINNWFSSKFWKNFVDDIKKL